jgi:Fe-S cluster biogenesis protein NfuA
VERTSDPSVLRWVCHDHAAVARPGLRRPPVDSTLGGDRVALVWVSAGAVHVQFSTSPPEAVAVARANDEIAGALDDGSTWLLEAAGPEPHPDLADVQVTVDAAAAGVFAAHGGRLEVVAVEGTTLILHPQGACAGCGMSASTLDAIAPAVRSAHPAIERVVLQQPPERHRVPLGRPRRAPPRAR